MPGVASGSLRHFFSPPTHPSALLLHAHLLARRYRPKRFADSWSRTMWPPCCAVPWPAGRVGHGYLLTGPTGRGEDHRGAYSGHGPQLPQSGRLGRPVRRMRQLPPGLERRRRPRRGRDRRGEQPRRRRRPRLARAGHVRRLARRAPQGLHRRRSAHAHAGGVERAPQGAGGAAAGRRLRLRHHRAAEDRGRRGAGALAPPALRFPPDRARAPSASGCARCSTPKASRRTTMR